MNVGSVAGLRGAGSSLLYGVTKAAVHQLGRGLAIALAPEVRVNSVAPGLVATRWFRRLSSDEMTDALEAASASQTPLGRVTTPEDVAQVILGLLAANMVTGETVVVDGGKSLAY